MRNETKILIQVMFFIIAILYIIVNVGWYLINLLFSEMKMKLIPYEYVYYITFGLFSFVAIDAILISIIEIHNEKNKSN